MHDSEQAARLNALQSIELIKTQVMPILEALATDRTQEVTRLLIPQDADYEKVFVGRAVSAAHEAYTTLWSAPLDLTYPTAEQSSVRCFVAPAGMLGEENELSHEFPGGYRKLARWLNPHNVWVRWKYVRPGETSGLAYDGLVWCEDHWAWFPKPYRLLAHQLDDGRS